MPSFSSALTPSSSGLGFGTASLRWAGYFSTIDLSGSLTTSGRIGIKNFEDIQFADQFSGTVTQQIDGALTALSSVGLVVIPSTMGAGNATSIPSGKCILDLRAGAPKFFTNFSTSSAAWTLNNNGTFTSQGLVSASSNPASTGFIRAASADIIYFRNNANSGDIAGLQKNASDIVQVGGAAGASVAGQLTLAGALSGVTTGMFSGQITSSLATGTAPFSISSTTVVPNLSVANINGVTVSGTPAASSYALISTGTTTATWQSLSSTYKLENIQYTPVTFVSSAGGTYFTYSLPANELAVGQALRITASGTYTNTAVASRTFTITMKAGATTWLTYTIALSNASVTNDSWSVEALAICTASGSSGTLEIQGINVQTPNPGSTTSVRVSTNTATVAFDTTSSSSLTLNVTQTNDATTASSGRQFMVERLG